MAKDSKDSILKILNKALQSAKELDTEAMIRLVSSASSKAKSNSSILSSVSNDLTAMLRLLKARSNGFYDQTPWQSIVVAAAAILYFVNPFDAVSDFIPGAGYLDDITVLAWTFRSIRVDIDKFLDWEREHKD